MGGEQGVTVLSRLVVGSAIWERLKEVKGRVMQAVGEGDLG